MNAEIYLKQNASRHIIPVTYNVLNNMKFEPKYLKFNDCLKSLCYNYE